jgi:hypothetical protein
VIRSQVLQRKKCNLPQFAETEPIGDMVKLLKRVSVLKRALIMKTLMIKLKYVTTF